MFACGGGNSSENANNVQPPESVPIVSEDNYSFEEATLVYASAFSLVEGAVEVSQLIESEFTYFVYENNKREFRPCINNGKVYRDFSNEFKDIGRITFLFENCQITPYQNEFGLRESFFYHGEVTVDYEILERTETLINEYNLPGVVNYALHVSSSDFQIESEGITSTIVFDFNTTINQTWNFDSYLQVQPGKIVKQIEVANFFAPLLSEEFDQINNTIISHTQLPDENVTQGETFNGTIHGEFVSSLDNSKWVLNSALQIDAASDTVSGEQTLSNNEDVISSIVDFGNIFLSYNGQTFGTTLYNEIFERSLQKIPTTWTLMTFLRDQVPLVATEDNLTAEILNNELEEIDLAFSTKIATSNVSVTNFKSSFYTNIEHSISDNKLNFPSSSIPLFDLFTINVTVFGLHVGSSGHQKYGFDRSGRGHFVWLPEVKSYIPSNNKFFGSENREMYTYNIDGTKVNSKEITTIESVVCTSKKSGNLFLSSDRSDELLEINPENLNIIDRHPPTSLLNLNNSSYCEEKYYIQKGNTGEEGIIEYDLNSKTQKTFLIDSSNKSLLIIAHPTLENTIITTPHNSGGHSNDKLEVNLISNLDNDYTKETFAFEDVTTCRYNDAGNAVFLYAETSKKRLYACNHVLDLDDLSTVIHKFGDVSNNESILFVDPELDLIVTSQGIYDATNFEVIIDISFLSMSSFYKVMKANNSLFFETDNGMYFVLDLSEFL